MKQPQCIVFDVDDTLYLEREYVRSGLRAVDEWLLGEHGVEGFGSKAWAQFEQGVRGQVFNRALEMMEPEIPDHIVPELVRVYRTHEPDIALLDDARQCLEKLHGDYQLAALTAGPVPSQHAKVEVLDLGRWCTPVIYAGRWGTQFDKPHPRPYREMENRTGFAGEQCIYVSDNPHKNFISPRRMGWHTARIRRPGSQHFGVDCSVSTPEFADLNEFAQWLVFGG